MRQLDADLRRFFARRMVRGAFLLVIAIMLIAVVVRSANGHAPSAADDARYRTELQQVGGVPPPTFVMPNGTIVENGPGFFVEPPSDTRLKLHDTLPDSMEGTGVAMLFTAFVLGASFVGAEFNVGSLTTQLLYEPRRGRVHVAKALTVAFGCAAFATAALAILAVSLYAGATLHGVIHDVDGAWWLHRVGEAGRIVGALALAGTMAYGVTLVARRTTAGIIAFFLQYPLLFLIDPAKKPFGVISHYEPIRGLLVMVLDPSHANNQNQLAIHTIAGGVVLSCVWVAVILALSGRVFARAEVR